MQNTGNLVATKSILEKRMKDDDFRKQVDKAVDRFEKQDWGDVTMIDAESNLTSILRCRGLILGCYKTKEGYINVIQDGKQDKTTVAFWNEYV